MSDARGLEFRPPVIGVPGMDGLERGLGDGNSDDETDLLLSDLADLHSHLVRVLSLVEIISDALSEYVRRPF